MRRLAARPRRRRTRRARPPSSSTAVAASPAAGRDPRVFSLHPPDGGFAPNRVRASVHRFTSSAKLKKPRSASAALRITGLDEYSCAGRTPGASAEMHAIARTQCGRRALAHLIEPRGGARRALLRRTLRPLGSGELGRRHGLLRAAQRSSEGPILRHARVTTREYTPAERGRSPLRGLDSRTDAAPRARQPPPAEARRRRCWPAPPEARVQRY